MAWRTALLEINGRPAHSMVDDRFAAAPPTAQLPRLAWFGLYCRLDPRPSFWHPDEGTKLDEIEIDLLRLCDAFGNGWAAYVQRLDTPGIREYYLYFGTGASLDRVLVPLKSLHPDYRLEYDTLDDPAWAQYRSWLTRLNEGKQPAIS